MSITFIGTQIDKAIQHTTDIKEIALSQIGDAKSAMLAFVDRSGSMYLTMVFRPKLIKMESMVESIRWNDAANVLAVIVEHRLILWYCPQVFKREIKISCDLLKRKKGREIEEYIHTYSSLSFDAILVQEEIYAHNIKIRSAQC